MSLGKGDALALSCLNLRKQFYNGIILCEPATNAANLIEKSSFSLFGIVKELLSSILTPASASTPEDHLIHWANDKKLIDQAGHKMPSDSANLALLRDNFLKKASCPILML